MNGFGFSAILSTTFLLQAISPEPIKDFVCQKVNEVYSCVNAVSTEYTAQNFLKKDSKNHKVIKTVCRDPGTRYAVMCNTPGCDVPPPVCYSSEMVMYSYDKSVPRTIYDTKHVTEFMTLEEKDYLEREHSITTSTITISGSITISSTGYYSIISSTATLSK